MDRLLVLGLAATLTLVACAGDVAPPAPSALVADEALPPAGIPDRGDDPAVVAIAAGDGALCGGTLVAPDAVLTSRRCLSVTALRETCPDGSPQVIAELAPGSLRVLVGDRVAGAEERALGRQVLVPDADVACGADVAILLLDTPIDDIQPLAVRTTGAARGDPLRTAGYAAAPGAAWQTKLVRDNVIVSDVSATKLTVSEACSTSAGGPAIDEATAEVVGVAAQALARGCGGPSAAGVYLRADAYLSFIAGTLHRYAVPSGASTGKAKTWKGDVDVGAPCMRGADCAAGVCLEDGSREYCSHVCDAHDRCPAHTGCKRFSSPTGPGWACGG